MRERSAAGVRDQSGKAFSAAATASSTSRVSLSGDLRIWFARRRLDVVEILAADRLNELPVDEVLNLEWFSAHDREILGVVVAKSMLRGELKRRTPGRLTLSESGPVRRCCCLNVLLFKAHFG